MQNQVPTLRQIYFNDVLFESFVKMGFGSLFFFLVISFVEPMFRLIVGAFTIPLSLLGIFLTIYRYNLIRTTFQDGFMVKAKLLYRENIAVHSENSSAVKSRKYYITIGYKVNGVDYKQTVRLPSSFFLFGIKHDGQEFDLMVKETSPKNAFLRHIYLEYDPTIPNE
jgi:hypothetical protein